MDDIKTLKIRPHHLLCMQGFQGYGYSEEFTANLSEIIERIKNNPHLNIEITTSCDDICIKCPHNKNGVCGDDLKVSRYDRETLYRLKLQPGTLIQAQDIFDFVNSRIKTAKEASAICLGCRWIEICLWHKGFDRE